MSATVPPYDILGLSPGAGQAEIESAYRRLIKQYHPDHAGGDGARAAEINRAYALLKDPVARARLDQDAGGAAAWANRRPAAWRAEDHRPRSRQRRSSGLGSILISAIPIALLVWLAVDARAGWWLDEQWQRLKGDVAHALAISPEVGFTASPSDGAVPAPIDFEAIRAGRRQASGIISRSGPLAAAETSRSCYRAYRRLLRSALLDHCLAFDQAAAATLLVQDRESTPYFEPLAITGRQLAAAQLLSSDYRWIEDRLDRVRQHIGPTVHGPPPPLAAEAVRPRN